MHIVPHWADGKLPVGRIRIDGPREQDRITYPGLPFLGRELINRSAGNPCQVDFPVPVLTKGAEIIPGVLPMLRQDPLSGTVTKGIQDVITIISEKIIAVKRREFLSPVYESTRHRTPVIRAVIILVQRELVFTF